MPVYVLWFVPLLVEALLAGFGVAYLLLRNRQGNGASAIEAKTTQTLSEAETQAQEKLLEAKEEAFKVRTAADRTVAVSVAGPPLPTDERKSGIVGKEGSNNRARQQATGIDLIVADAPEAVISSGCGPVRREVARVARNKLIVDGRVHPARI